jgi:hypothetical protein
LDERGTTSPLQRRDHVKRCTGATSTRSLQPQRGRLGEQRSARATFHPPALVRSGLRREGRLWGETPGAHTSGTMRSVMAASTSCLCSSSSGSEPANSCTCWHSVTKCSAVLSSLHSLMASCTAQPSPPPRQSVLGARRLRSRRGCGVVVQANPGSGSSVCEAHERATTCCSGPTVHSSPA